MVHRKIKYILVICLLTLSCKHEPVNIVDTNNSGYPENIGRIILNKCATSGCHNNASYKGAGGLNLTTWDKLFEGGSIGSAVIPYRPDFSTLCYYTNADTNLGVTLLPTMPVNQSPLSKAEYLLLKKWISSGAPNADGKVKFADNPTRKKIYVTNKLCDEVTVFDAETMLQMRYIKVGNKPVEEFPHKVKVSPDKKYWYVSFFVTSNIIQQFSAVDDKLVGEINIGNGAWASFAITKDSHYGFFVDNSNPGKIAYIDLNSMTLLATYSFNNKLRYPTGIAINETLKKVYVGNVNGNYIYAIDINNPMKPKMKEVILDNSKNLKYNSILDPTELIVNTHNNQCYIGCTKSGEVRVLDMEADTVSGTITLGSNPAYMSMSAATNKLFITCPDDTHSFPGNRGAVLVVDLSSGTVIKRLDSGYQPYGIAVDDDRQIVTVVNANLNPAGDEPHHASNCIGRNGNVTFINMHTLELIPGIRSEVAVYPFSADVR